VRDRRVLILMAIGLLGFAILPWYAIEDGFFSIEWLPYYPRDPELAPAILQTAKPWLYPLLLPLLAPLLAKKRPGILILSGGIGLVYTLAQGFVIGPLGWNFEQLELSGTSLVRRRIFQLRARQRRQLHNPSFWSRIDTAVDGPLRCPLGRIVPARRPPPCPGGQVGVGGGEPTTHS